MAGIRILRGMAGHLEQLHLDLKWGIGQLAQKLSFGDNLGGHEVQDQQVERAHVLVDCPVLCHDKDVFSLQRSSGRQRIRNLDGHRGSLLLCSSNI